MVSNLKVMPISHWLPKIDNPLLISGPCSLESEEQALSTARELAKDKRVFVYRGGIWNLNIPQSQPGSLEFMQYQGHEHGIGSSAPATGATPGGSGAATSLTAANGGSETRPVNMSVNYFMKY